MPSLLRFFRVPLIGLTVLAVADGGGLARAEGGDGGGAGTGGGAGAGSGSAAGAGTGDGPSGGVSGHGEAGDGSTGSGPGVSAAAASTGSTGSTASTGPAGGASSKGSAGAAASTGSAGLGSFLGGLGGFLTGGRDSATPRAGNAGRSELRSEQGLARDALSRGLVQPLDSILRNVETAVPGSVLSARLKRDDGGVWIYRLVILSPEGRYRNVVVDAARNAILQIR